MQRLFFVWKAAIEHLHGQLDVPEVREPQSPAQFCSDQAHIMLQIMAYHPAGRMLQERHNFREQLRSQQSLPIVACN